jgi:hypothetical protein
MSEANFPRWFTWPDGRSIYALTAADRLVEHQKIGNRHALHVLEAKTYPDRLRIQDLLAALDQGSLNEIERTEYERRMVDMESTPRIG